MVERRNTRCTGLVASSSKSSKYAASSGEIIADLEKLCIPKQLVKSRGVKNEVFFDGYEQDVNSLKKMPLKRCRKIDVGMCDDEVVEALARLIFTKDSDRKAVKNKSEKNKSDVQRGFKENIGVPVVPQALKENSCKRVEWVNRFPNTNANTHIKISWITQSLSFHRKTMC